MKTLVWAALLYFLTSFSACDRPDTGKSSSAKLADLTGKWVLSSPKTEFTVTLDINHKNTGAISNEYRLSGQSPVNLYNADALVNPDDGTLTVGNLVATKRGSTPEAMRVEGLYLNSLQQVEKAQLLNGKLYLDSRDTNWSRLIFDKL